MDDFVVYAHSHYKGCNVNNTANDFYTEFSPPIEFKHHYKVALMQYFYDSFIHTLTNETVVIVDKNISKKHVLEKSLHVEGLIIEQNYFGYYPEKNSKNCIFELSESLQKKIGLPNKKLSNKYSDYVLLLNNIEFTNDDYVIETSDNINKIKVGYHRFVTVEQLAGHLVTLLNQRFKFTAVGQKIKIKDFPENVEIKLENGLNVTLGFKDVIISSANCEGNYPIQLLRNTQTMYIYGDFIEPSRVSNTYSPILKIIAYTADDGMATFTAKVPQYFTISKSSLSSIHISVKSEDGTPFPFIENSKSMLVLHFHKQ